MPQLNAFPSFNCNCAEAVAFYARVLGAKFEAMLTYAQMPGGEPLAPPQSKT